MTLIARGEHLRALQEGGVRVLSPRGDFSAHPPATDDVDAIGDADAVFVALKAHSLPGLAARIGAALTPGTAVIAAQNGLPWWYFRHHPGPLEDETLETVDPGGAIGRAIPFEAVIGCVVYCSTELVAPGVVRHLEGTRFTIGEPDGSASPRCAEIAAAFAAGGLRCPVEARIRDQIWLKLIGNAAFNPVTALTGATLGGLGALPEMVDLLRAILEECAEVGARLGVELPVPIERRLEAAIAVGDHRTSMLQDVEAGKPLELDSMTGAVVELAGRLGIEVPHTATVYACAKLLDARLARERAAAGGAA